MEEYIAKVIFSEGEIVTIKNYAKNIFETIDNLVMMEEIIHVVDIVRVSDNKIYNVGDGPYSFLELREAREKIKNENLLRRNLQDLER